MYSYQIFLKKCDAITLTSVTDVHVFVTAVIAIRQSITHEPFHNDGRTRSADKWRHRLCNREMNFRFPLHRRQQIDSYLFGQQNVYCISPENPLLTGFRRSFGSITQFTLRSYRWEVRVHRMRCLWANLSPRMYKFFREMRVTCCRKTMAK
jgi:hypothetical protein